MPKRQPDGESALFVRLPAKAVAKLDRASEALGVAKKDLVAGLVTTYVDPDSPRGLDALSALSQARRGTVRVDEKGPTLGTYSFQAYDPPAPSEVMTAQQTAELLQLDEAMVLELAEAGDLPGRKLGAAWRFSRTAVLAWLANPAR